MHGQYRGNIMRCSVTAFVPACVTFWVGGQYRGFHLEHGTDCHVVDRDFLTSLEEVGFEKA
jgi:hypothetical protein